MIAKLKELMRGVASRQHRPRPAAEVSHCPFCGQASPADDVWAEIRHMKAYHPEVIEARLQEAGFRQHPDGSWYDPLTANPQFWN